MSGDAPLSIVHDHYKETFVLIRERERLRDRSFGFLIALFALLALEVYYPAQVGASIGVLHLLGTDIDLKQLPVALLIDATWVFALTIALGYCRTAAHVERQYPYLHHLEDWMSRALGDDSLYRREGRTYLSDYPAFLNWAWFSYVIVFPLIVVLGCLVLVIHEWTALKYSGVHKVFDSAIAVLIVASFGIYAVVPRIRWPFQKRASREAERAKSTPDD
jgi:hypothetical protein